MAEGIERVELCRQPASLIAFAVAPDIGIGDGERGVKRREIGIEIQAPEPQGEWRRRDRSTSARALSRHSRAGPLPRRRLLDRRFQPLFESCPTRSGCGHIRKDNQYFAGVAQRRYRIAPAPPPPCLRCRGGCRPARAGWGKALALRAASPGNRGRRSRYRPARHKPLPASRP